MKIKKPQNESNNTREHKLTLEKTTIISDITQVKAGGFHNDDYVLHTTNVINLFEGQKGN